MAFCLGLLLAAGVFVAGCGGSEQSRELTVGNIGWDENIAVSNLTKVLLEEEIGYENVELRTLDVEQLFEDVGSGDLDAFQDAWLPNHQAQLEGVENDVELLDPWFQGETEFGIAVPSYMDVTSLERLNSTDVEEIWGIEPSAVIMRVIPEEVIPAYGLRQDLVEAITPAMLAEVENLYNNGEEFAFVAWRPHWMNQRYDFRYLEDPKGALGELTESAVITTIVNENLGDNDPVAYAFMDALTLTEEQINNLENTINRVGDPLIGARQWARENPEIVQPWLDAAQDAQ